MDFYGTIGPACCEYSTLSQMYKCGMTGVRINLSHGMLNTYETWIHTAITAAKDNGIKSKILVDLQGPELRVGTLLSEKVLEDGSILTLGEDGIPVPEILFEQCKTGNHLLLDDGKLEVEVQEVYRDYMIVKVLRGGILKSRKSMAVCNMEIVTPTLTEQDLENLKTAREYGVTGVMLPFVRNAQDLQYLKKTLNKYGLEHVKIFAKIENMQGVEKLETFMNLADEIVIARGDLGNSMPLWKLPGVQKRIAGLCKNANQPFMVVTQMLDSMEHCQVPTRAEVSDIYNAVLDGASSVMLTGETAAGKYPVEAMTYLVNTAREAMEERANEY